ncbi:MAG: hypothetical protein JRG91_19115 [Deltaproteobacteria bacterium]|nr:hypothetical protein [Deltaproteobacteria bacterium]
MHHWIVASASLLALSGCYSTSIHGDAGADPRPDGTDVSVDTSVEPASDPVDAHEVPADILPDGTETCPPAGDGVWLTWSLDGLEYDEGREIDIPCTVTSVAGEDVGHTIIDMTCGTGGRMERHVIEIFSNPHPWIEHITGTEVMLNYVSTPWEWQDRWFSLRYYGGEIIIAGTTASALAPPGRTVDEWYYPLSVQFVTGLCPQVDLECGLSERAALDVEFWDDRKLVFDSTSTILGGVAAASVTVDTAWFYETMECMDFPYTYMNALFVLLLEG